SGSIPIENGPYIKDGKPNGRPQLSGVKKLKFENEVYNKNLDPDGVLRDPNTGDVIEWKPGQPRKDIVDFGHKSGNSYKDMFEKYKNREITLDKLKEFQFDPDNYRLENLSTNRSHKYE
ncbi:MAG: GH-E family nuclease, partial [Erysipelotrichaceae bacterium]